MYLGIDVGGTTIKFAIINEEYKIVHYENCLTPNNIDVRIVDEMYKISKKLKEKYDFNYIGISTAGVVDTNKAEIVDSGINILNYIGTNFQKELGDKLGVKVYADNDVNCALLGEQWLGSAKGLDEVFCIALGTGIGGAYYLNSLPAGSNFSVGEVGRGKYDRTTNTNYEQRASTLALDRKIKKEINEKLSVKEFFKLCKNEDEKCLTILDEWLTHLADGLVDIMLILDPKYIVIGGAVSHQGEYLLNLIRNKVKELHPIKINKTKFLTASLGNDAALYGAISVFINK